MPTTIENMIEIAKQKIPELGGAAFNIVKAPIGIAAGAISTPVAAWYDTAANAVKGVPRAAAAVTGLEAPKGTDFNYSAAAKTTGLIGSSISDAAKGFGVIGQNLRGGLKTVGFTEPTPKPTSETNFGAAVNQPPLNLAREGATATPTAPTAPAPAIAEPSQEKPKGGVDLAEWQAERDRQNSIINGKSPEYLALEKERSNPNNALFKEIVDKVKDINTFMSGDPLTRKYQTLQLGALNQTLDKLAPLTSYGHFGVAGIHDETTKRGQDITAETTQRGQDIDKEIKAPYYEANAKESEAKSKLYGTQAKILEEEGKPDKVREKEVSGWLTERRKVILEGLSELDPNAPPELQAKHEANLKARFDRNFSAPEKKRIDNKDGTMTVIFADGKQKKYLLPK